MFFLDMNSNKDICVALQPLSCCNLFMIPGTQQTEGIREEKKTTKEKHLKTETSRSKMFYSESFKVIGYLKNE